MSVARGGVALHPAAPSGSMKLAPFSRGDILTEALVGVILLELPRDI